MSNDPFMDAALEQATLALSEGGIPTGAVLVLDDVIVGRGRNRQVQSGSAILHAVTDCIENAGRLTAQDYRRSRLYTTIPPCDMCAGAILLYKIPKVIVGESQSYRGPDQYLEIRGVRYQVLCDRRCGALVNSFMEKEPELWRQYLGLD